MESSFWAMSKSNYYNEEEDDDSFIDNDYDSEEEAKRQLEEELFCQMYYEQNEEKLLKDDDTESSCKVISADNLQESTLNESEKIFESEKTQFQKRKRKENDLDKDTIDALNSHKKQKKIAETLPGEIPAEEGGEFTAEDVKMLHKTPDDVKTVPPEPLCDSTVFTVDDSSISSDAVMVDIDYEISVESESDESIIDGDDSDGKKLLRIGRKNAEVIDVSDTSSDSSLFLCAETDNDIDIHLDSAQKSYDDRYLQTILDDLPAEGDWKVNHFDQFGSEKSRYYKSSSRVRCHNCNNRGHLAQACPEPRKKVACIFCGNRGHLSRHCSQSLCFRCNKPGHSARDCDKKRVWHEDVCRRCGMQGHFKTDCPDIWRQYHLTTKGDEIVTGPKMENHRKFCYNCAINGHFGHECKKRRQDIYLPPQLPFVAKYSIKQIERGQVMTPNSKKKQNFSTSLMDMESSYSRKSKTKFGKLEGSSSYLDSSSKYNGKTKAQKDSSDNLDSSRSFNRTKSKEESSYCPVSSYSQQNDSKSQNPEDSVRSSGASYSKSQNQEESRNEKCFQSKKKEVSGELRSDNWTNFAQKMKTRHLENKKKKKKAKETPKKTKEAKNPLQLDFLRLPPDMSRDKNEAHPGSSKKSSNFGKDELPCNILSKSKSSIGHLSVDGSYLGDFPRSNNKNATDTRNISGDQSEGPLRNSLSFDTPKDLKNNGSSFVSQRFKWNLSSTPECHLKMRDRRKTKFIPNDLDENAMMKEYYGSKQLKNAKRKERRKKKKVPTATLR